MRDGPHLGDAGFQAAPSRPSYARAPSATTWWRGKTLRHTAIRLIGCSLMTIPLARACPSQGGRGLGGGGGVFVGVASRGQYGSPGRRSRSATPEAERSGLRRQAAVARSERWWRSRYPCPQPINRVRHKPGSGDERSQESQDRRLRLARTLRRPRRGFGLRRSRRSGGR